MQIDTPPLPPAAIPLPAPSAPNDGRRAASGAATDARGGADPRPPRRAPERFPATQAPAAGRDALPAGLPAAPFLAQYIAQQIMPARSAPDAVAAYARQTERTEADRAAAFDAFAWPETRLGVDA